MSCSQSGSITNSCLFLDVKYLKIIIIYVIIISSYDEKSLYSRQRIIKLDSSSESRWGLDS